MIQNNYLRIASCIPKVHLGQPQKNADEIIKLAAKVSDAAVVLFPEMSLTGYSLGDWVTNQELLDQAFLALETVIKSSTEQVWIIGGPYVFESNLYNVAFVIQNKKILGIVPKMHLPSYREFFEKRLYTSGMEYYHNVVMVRVFGQEVPFGEIVFTCDEVKFGIEICEDLWQNYAPHHDLYNEGAHVVFNLSSSTFQVEKHNRRKSLCENASYLGSGAYVYVSTGITETSSDVIFSGDMIASELGEILYDYESITKDENYKIIDIDIEKIEYRKRLINEHVNSKSRGIYHVPYYLRRIGNDDFTPKRIISPFPFSLKNDKNKQDTINIISSALYHRLTHIGINKIVLGLSGGLDSTLALLMINYCFEQHNLDKKGIIVITMPGLGTGKKSKNNAFDLCKSLNIDLREIGIEEEVRHHFALIGKTDTEKDVTYENIQARYRTLVLMNIANKENGIVCGTGDMSEIALGWSTFNGDQMSMYNINGGLPKTTIRELVEYFKKIYPVASSALDNVINLPISPELTSSNQLTEDIIGKYEINDFIMYYIFVNGASKKRIVMLLKNVFTLSASAAEMYYSNFMRRFCRNQFKRLTGPESIKIFSFSFSCRSDLHFPGDMKY